MSKGAIGRGMAAAGIVVLLIGGLLSSHTSASMAAWHLADFMPAFDPSSRFGWLIFALAQIIVALSGVLPASMLGIMAGTLYGVWYGFALAAISTLLGAIGAFALSRSLFRTVIERMLARQPRIRAINTAVSRDAWRTVCLMRISPVMPFAATSYLLGLTHISFRAYTVGTLACLPALFGYVLIGHFTHTGLGYLSRDVSLFSWLLLGAGMAATVALTLRLGVIIRRAGLLNEQ